ncbi:MAG: tRNA (N(6)-L-threonylcarbamoyladenosine(37)-C(2))-methylthiotransferase MtaB [Bdellovibrionota bacterium]
MGTETHSKTYVVRTLGCKANVSDSQAIELDLRKNGWLPAPTPQTADLCIVNSCTVTDEADRQSRKFAAKFKKMNPDSRVLMTGCGAEVAPELVAGSPGVDYVLGNQDKHRFGYLVSEAFSKIQNSNKKTQIAPALFLGKVSSYGEILSRHPMDREWPGAGQAFSVQSENLIEDGFKTRAFLKIQEGCNAFCTYCIIPYGRGPSRSLAPDMILGQVRKLTKIGLREIVITGTNIGDYGNDLIGNVNLESLLIRIFGETSIERVRVSSLDPTEITTGILDLMESEPRFCPHFHVSLQSPLSKILKLMKRNYGEGEVRECLQKLVQVRGGTTYVGMDLITGFPGESREDFDRTVAVLEELPWTRLHVFPYSERSGTPATRLPGIVPREERVRRTKYLNRLSLDRFAAHYRRRILDQKKLGTQFNGILLERPSRGPDGSEGWVSGYTPDYLRVWMRAGGKRWNEIVSANILEIWVDRAAGDVAGIEAV